MVRAARAMTLLLTMSCAGGQTGEITELTACRDPVGTTPVDAASSAGRAATDQLAALTTAAELDVLWEGRDTVGLEVSFALTEAPAVLLGGPECARPWLEAPVTITLRTADGALDEDIAGTALLADAQAASVRASVPVDGLTGSFDPTRAHPHIDASTATLVVTLQAGPGGLGGRLALAADDANELDLTSF